MKKIFIILLAGFCAAAAGCSETDSGGAATPAYVPVQTEFDLWLDVHYRASYNIDFKYKYDDNESDKTYDVVPADEFSAKIIAKLIEFLWLDAYTEVAGFNFMRRNSPRVLHLIGSGSYLSGNLRLGTAEGGKKITVYVGNWITDMLKINYLDGNDASKGYTLSDFDIQNINGYFLHTIHHEFSHILDQNKERSKDFDTISAGDYTAAWTNVDEYTALQMGFVSKYASSSAVEDFAEVFSTYITSTDDDWNAMLLSAGENGASAINDKLSIIKNYTKQSWNFDIDELKTTLMRRYQELPVLDWDNFEL